MKAKILVLALALVASKAMAVEPAVITFTAPTTYTDGSAIDPAAAITYRVLQGLKGAAKTKVAEITGTTATVTSGLVAGTDVCFAVTAVINGVESAPSNEACKSFPFPIPQAVVITVK